MFASMIYPSTFTVIMINIWLVMIINQRYILFMILMDFGLFLLLFFKFSINLIFIFLQLFKDLIIIFLFITFFSLGFLISF